MPSKGSENTSIALTNVGLKIEEEVEEMKKSLSSDGISPEELEEMSNGFVTMGENLSELSDGLNAFHDKSGMMLPYFPHNQKELGSILYDDGGNLRDVFSDTIIDDNHMMMIIKLDGNLEDSIIDSKIEGYRVSTQE